MITTQAAVRRAERGLDPYDASMDTVTPRPPVADTAAATVMVALGYPGGELVLACCEADAGKWAALQARDGMSFRQWVVQA